MKISCSRLKQEIKAVVPGEYLSIFLSKSSLSETSEQMRCDSKQVQKVVSKINSSNVDFVFVSVKTFFNQSVLAQKFRARGFKCISVSLAPRLYSERDDVFDETYHLSLIEMINVLQQTRTKVFSQGWLFRYNINVILELFKCDNSHFVDVMDLNTLMFPANSSIHASALKRCWGEDAPENNRMQNWCENYLLKESDRIYFPGSVKSVVSLGLNQNEVGRRYFVNHPILQDMFTRDEESNGLVFAGGVPPFDDRRVPEIFADAQLITTFAKFLGNDFSWKLDVYNNPYILPIQDYKRAYKPHYDLLSVHPNYGFFFGMEGGELRARLSTYKAGLMIYDFEGNVIGQNHFKNIIPTKFYTYLEAGLPILISEEFEEASAIVKMNNIGLVLTQQDLPSLGKILRNVNFAELGDNVIKFRQSLYNDSLKELE